MAKDKSKSKLDKEPTGEQVPGLASLLAPPALRPVVERRGEIKPVDFKFNMGDEVRDIVTGLEGVITGREDCITGCSRMSVQPKVTDGKTMPSGYFIDQDRLELLVEADAPLFEVVRAGGPMTAAPMQSI